MLNDLRLKANAKNVIADPNNSIWVSPVSFWEIAIKISLGKYSLNEPYQVFMEREIAANNFAILPVEIKHAAILASLPFHHRDPFDRMLVAQAMVENVPLISADPVLDAYPIQRIW